MKTREHIIEFIKKQKVSFIASVNEEGRVPQYKGHACATQN